MTLVFYLTPIIEQMYESLDLVFLDLLNSLKLFEIQDLGWLVFLTSLSIFLTLLNLFPLFGLLVFLILRRICILTYNFIFNFIAVIINSNRQFLLVRPHGTKVHFGRHEDYDEWTSQYLMFNENKNMWY